MKDLVDWEIAAASDHVNAQRPHLRRQGLGAMRGAEGLGPRAVLECRGAGSVLVLSGASWGSIWLSTTGLLEGKSIASFKD
jgi:hypothetical protein